MLTRLRRSRSARVLAQRLLADTVSRAREPAFYAEFGVPDTIDGRFDLIVLHAWMVLERLGELENRILQQRLTDALFISFDEGLRDLGAGDIGIGHRMKKMANAFYGRCLAYRGASNRQQLEDTLLRNVFRGEGDRRKQARRLAEYVQTARASLSLIDPASEPVEFGALPER